MLRLFKKIFTLTPQTCYIQPQFDQLATMQLKQEMKHLEKPPSALKKFCYNLSGFREYGLMRDDLLFDDISYDVAEALKRLPAELYDERGYRIARASQLNLNHEVLPKSMWTKIENDVLYLTPLVEEVRRERQERIDWDNNNC